jgi:phosphate acyltransferase
MGGDKGADLVVPAALKALAKFEQLHLILVGQDTVLKKKLQRRKALNHPRLTVQHASEVVAMDEKPSQAIRYKKDSSIRVAINQVKEGKAQACVSAGNTGALMGTAHFVLKTLPGIDRPAIIGMIPSQKKAGFIRMLDLGANVDSSASQLFQFAVMGAILAEEVDGIPKPRVALLNVGEEEMKGNEQVKQTNKLLSNTPEINYVGYAEGNDIFNDKAEVVVCDGFVGNVALKTSEGLARFVRNVIQQAFSKNLLTKTAAVVASPVLLALRNNLNPAKYNGASLVGLKGIVIKSHGNTSVTGFVRAIEYALLEVENNVPAKISKKVEALLKA